MRRAIRSLSRTTPALSRASAVSAGLPAQLPPRLSARSSSLLSLPQLPWSAGGTRCLSIAAAQQRPVPQLPKLQPEWIPPRDKGPLALNRIRDNFGANLKKTRVGRGIGTGRGRKSGRGNNGMRARAGNHGFLKQAGGQTNMIKRVPKKGFTRPRKEYCWVNLDKLQSWIMSGRLPAPTKEAPVTIKDLFDQKMITHRNRYSGIRLLGRGCLNVEIPMHIEAQMATPRAIEAIEAKGGSVTTVYYSQLTLRALLKPQNFLKKNRLLPRPALPPPKLMLKYMDPDKRGYLADLKPGDVVRPHEHPPHVDLSARNPPRPTKKGGY